LIPRLAVAGYRSLRDLVLELGQLTVITGPRKEG
jgi:predicted ATPase